MAQGCHLIYSNSDREHFPLQEVITQPSVEEVAKKFHATFNLPWTNIFSQKIMTEDGLGVKVDRAEASKYLIGKDTIDKFEERFNELLPEDKAMVTGLLCTFGDRQVDLMTGLGNPYLKSEMAVALPQALQEVYKHDPGTCGLFNCARAGASAWVSNLKNEAKGKADGIAYEVLATARLLRKPTGDLKIYPTDQVDFGSKGQATYGSGTFTVTDGWVKEPFFQPCRKTIEADLLITRPHLDGNAEQIAVDFKHYTSGPAAVDEKQLQGIQLALKTGEFSEWHFVTNADSYQSSVVEKVNEINQDLANSGTPPIQLHTNYNWR